MTAKKTLQETATYINGRLDEYEGQTDCDRKMLRAVVGDMVRFASDAGWVYTQRYTWDMAGVDPTNRYGEGLDPERVHALTLAIFRAGWCDDEVRDALAREVLDGDADDEAKKMNVHIAEESNGALPPVDVSKLKILTLSNGHTTSSLGCFGHGCITHNEELLKTLCHDGRFSLAKLRELQPNYANTVSEGLMYRVIRKELHSQCPRLAGYAQEALNMGQAVAQQETCFQVIRKVHSEAVKYQQKNKPIDFEAIKSSVGATRPTHAVHMDGYASFVANHVDVTGQLLTRISTYLKGVPFKASVKGLTFAAIATQKCLGAEEYIEALVKSHYCPGKTVFIKNGFATLLATNELPSVTGKHWDNVQKAAKILRDTEACLRGEDADLAEPLISKLIGEFGRDFVMHIHSKSKVHKDLQDVATSFYGRLKDELPPKAFEKLKIPPSLAKKLSRAESSTPTSDTPPQKTSMRTLTEKGAVDMIEELRRMNFAVGDAVVQTAASAGKKQPTPTAIKAITKTKVKLANDTEIDHTTFITTYLKSNVVPEVVLQAIGDATRSQWWQSEYYSGFAKLLLESAFNLAMNNTLNDKLKVIVKPLTKVVAKTDLAAGVLNLVPLSPVVRFACVTEKTANMIKFSDVAFEVSDKRYVCIIVPRKEIIEGECVPCFCVRDCKDSAESNMEWTTIVTQSGDQSYKVPCLTNITAIKTGVELRLYGGSQADERKRQAAEANGTRFRKCTKTNA
jgi:hypothetical protein